MPKSAIDSFIQTKYFFDLFWSLLGFHKIFVLTKKKKKKSQQQKTTNLLCTRAINNENPETPDPIWLLFSTQ